MLPLEGLTVVALEQAVAAPFATRQLADLGARVIKVERPGAGDFARGYDRTVRGQSSYFVWLNRSKESISLDLKHHEGRAILERLLEGADVFVQNLLPGAAVRLGLGKPELRERYPRLIVCDLSGFGSDGPYRDKKAYDLLIQCETGVLSVTGTPDTPSKAGISVADIAGGMYAFSGILLALYRRAVTGEGSAPEVSLFDALSEWMSQPAYFARYGGAPPPRTGASHATIAPYGPFRTGDGQTVFLGIQNEREWARFCSEVLAQPALAEDGRFASNAERVANRAALHGVIEGVFAGMDAERLLARLEEAGIANARLREAGDLWDHPQVAERDRTREVSSPGGPIDALLPPIAMDGVDLLMGPIPSPGQHTEAILRSLGWETEEIARLRAEGVV